MTGTRTASVVAVTPMKLVAMFSREFKRGEDRMPAIADNPARNDARAGRSGAASRPALLTAIRTAVRRHSTVRRTRITAGR